MPTLIYRDDMSEVWAGDCLLAEHVDAVLAGRTADAVVVDAPYSAKTHKGHADGKVTTERARAFATSQSNAFTPTTIKQPLKGATNRRAARRYARHAKRRDIEYDAWTDWDVECFVAEWSPACGWLVSITDSVLVKSWNSAAEDNGRVSFAPLPLVETGSRARMTGDGPSSWTCFISVSRLRCSPWSKWGALRGAYVVPGERRFNAADPFKRIMGGKPLQAMLQLVEDYSRRGEMVIDPCCGAGTTLVAAKMLGRYSIGIEKDPATAAIAARNLQATATQNALPWRELGIEQGLLFESQAEELPND